jgi:hypothetical protein
MGPGIKGRQSGAASSKDMMSSASSRRALTTASINPSQLLPLGHSRL